jgi:hypothetical protein
MAAGDAFSVVPNRVVPDAPVFFNIETASESMKKEFYNLSSTPVERFLLVFNALSAADKTTLLNHYRDQYGGYHDFVWSSVPSYISSGANITGRWVGGSLEMQPAGHNLWACQVRFEKDNG